MFTSSRQIVAFAAIALCTGALAHAQSMRASCDNRQGTSFADVIDSSDPNQSSYNVDPSEIYRSFTAINFPNSQTVGGNTASANLNVNSRFLGANPATATTGFIMDNICSASVTRVNMGVWAFANDTTAVCITVTGAGVNTPLRLRLNGNIVASGGATGRLRLTNSGNQDLINVTSGPINKVFALPNGTYNFTGSLATGNLQPTAPATLSRSVNVYASLVCIADFDGSGTTTVGDIFAFLTAWFGGNLSADSDANGSISVQDIFTYLHTWFSGCTI